MRLTISVFIGDDTSEEAVSVQKAKNIVKSLLLHANEYEIKAALVRDGDRSQGNLLAPVLDGVTGQHYRNKKIDIKEIVGEHVV